MTLPRLWQLSAPPCARKWTWINCASSCWPWCSSRCSPRMSHCGYVHLNATEHSDPLGEPLFRFPLKENEAVNRLQAHPHVPSLCMKGNSDDGKERAARGLRSSMCPWKSWYLRITSIAVWSAHLTCRSCARRVQETYACKGRPSIDPVVFFKLQVVLFFEDIRSERLLMRLVADRLSVRWYLGYDLGEALPEHSSLTRIRARYGLEVFRRFFETIVEQCLQAKLVWGKELYVDATQVNANAATTSLIPRFAIEAREAIQAHLAALFPTEEPSVHGP